MIRSLLHCRLALALLGTLVALGSRKLWAHDVPDRSFDRSIQVSVHSGRIQVSYQLSLTQLTLAEELLALVGAGGVSGASPAERLDRYASEMGPLLARGLLMRVDDVEQPFRFTRATHRVEDHPRFVFEMESHLEGGSDTVRRLTLEDTNFFLEKGRIRIAIRTAATSKLNNSSVPGDIEEVQVRPSWEMTPEQQDRARRAEAAWQAVAAHEGSNPGDGPSGVALTSQHDAGTDSLMSIAAEGAAKEERPAPEGLLGLMDRQSHGVLAVLLAMAFFFGAAHAMTPGHGKTMVAAYLVGERGTLRHAVGLGLATSLTHTSSVLVVAIVLALVAPALEQKINTGLSLLSGLMVAALGAGLLIVRLRQRQLDPQKAGSKVEGCSSSCGRDHGEAASDGVPPVGPSWTGMLTLGISGGIVPCWDAVALLLFAAAQGQITRALYLLISFSAGLASALVMVGILAVKLRGYLTGRIGSGRIVQTLPLLSAAAILAVGLYLSVLTLHATPGTAPLENPAVNRMAGP